MRAEKVSPLQLLLEGVALVTIGLAFGTSVTAFSVTDDGIVVRTVFRMAQTHVPFYGESKVAQELDIHIGDALQGVAYCLILVQLVFPYHMTVLVLIACGYFHILLVGIITGIVLALTIDQAVGAVRVVQMYGIDGGYLTAIHKGVCKRGTFVACGNLRILMAARQVNTSFKPFYRIQINRYACRKAVET